MIKPDVTFALVKTFYRNGRNHYKSFLPLVLDCAQALSGDYISVTELQEKYKALYGLILPQSVIRKILLTGKSENYFIFEGELIKKTVKVNTSTIREEQNKYIREHDCIVNRFVKYYYEISGENITYDVAEHAMFDFMDENVYKLIKNDVIKKNEQIITTGNVIKIAFGRYIRNAIQISDEETLSYISDIAKGVMIQNAIYLPNDDSIERKFTDTIIIFDTPIILALLGYAGIDRQRPILELVEMAKSSGARIGVFDFTLSEVAAVLGDCANRIRNKSDDHHGKSIEYFIEQNFSFEEINVFIGRLEKDIHKNAIEILEKSKYSKYQYVDELKLEQCIDSKLNYRHRSSKLNDISALSITFSIRKGVNPLYLENSKAIFITSNFQLVMAAKDYFKDSRPLVDIAMTDFYLTNILWLKKPTRYPDLPMKRVVADICAALQPNDAIWSSFIAEAESMQNRGDITYDDVITLRTSSQSPDLVFDASLEGTSILSPSSIKEILTVINDNKKKELRESQIKRMQKRAQTAAKILSNIIYIILAIIIFVTLLVQIIGPIKNKTKMRPFVNTLFQAV